ncbi:MAG: adenylosuccinate lyase [Proteobacteria bacterium]|jgi:adenylosuccinate lyase|nr:adenylosuccinate lyase [Pseudomonadota bacterium]
MNHIKAISPLDGRYFSKVSSLAELVSEFGLIKYRIKVEIEWLKILFAIPNLKLPSLSVSEITLLDSIVTNFNEDECERVKTIEATTNHDVKAVEYYIKEKVKHNLILNQYREFIHFACTSEDINNLSYALMLKDLKDRVLSKELSIISDKLLHLSNEYKAVPMMCRTHGQPATPSTMGKELYNVYFRLQRQLEQLSKQQILGKINGAVGNYNAHMVAYPDIDWAELAQVFVEDKLGLTFNPYTTQIEPHDYMAELFDNLKRINTILIDLSRDMWGYIALNYFKQKVLANEVGSSTMPHKVNPIDFENCEGNLGLANSLAIHLSEKLPISRWQRDLTDSTVQRNIGVVIGYSMLAYSSLLKGMSKLEINLDVISKELDNNWELLAEPIQTVMRKVGIENAYEKLKELTRGKKVDAAIVRDFINTLELPVEEKAKLLLLTPHNYIGLATKLIDNK